MYIIEKKMPEIMILAFLYVYLKKKMLELMILAFLYVNEKKNAETIVPVFYM
jgi:hypothetical protein